MLLVMGWRDEPVSHLYAVQQTERIYRLVQDLSGIWRTYDSPTQAYQRELRLAEQQEEPGFFRSKFKGTDVVLPSDAALHVVARRFVIPPEWGTRTGQLVLEGVSGAVRVFVNGIGTEALVAETESYGGGLTFLIQTARLYFDKENIIIIEFSDTSLDKNMPLGNLFRHEKNVTGRVRLEALPDVALAQEKLRFVWEEQTGVARVYVTLTQNEQEDNDWVVSGVLRDRTGAVAASTQAELTPDSEKPLLLTFTPANPHLWTPQDPYLYQLSLTVRGTRGEQDILSIPWGLTSVSQNGASWLLNGEVLAVNGIFLSRREEKALRAGGEELDSWMALQKENGFNTLCFYESFPEESWFFAADRVGMGVWTAFPVNFLRDAQIPALTDFSTMLDMLTRHPSHWAALAGTNFASGENAAAYLAAISADLGDKPIFVGSLTGENGVSARTLVLTEPSGTWGRLQLLPSREEIFDLTSGRVRTGVLIWCGVLLLVFFVNARSKPWYYKNLHERHRRSMRESCFWLTLAFLCRMATIAGTWLLLFFHLSLAKLEPLPLDLTWLESWRRQPFLVLWLVLTIVFACCRLLQWGIAAKSFQNAPALGLVCWSERRYSLFLLVGVAWVAVTFGLPWYLPLVVYYGLVLFFWPLRFHDVYKVGGSNAFLLLLPILALLSVMLFAASQWQDWWLAPDLWRFFLRQNSLT
jgi:hypothetical protein